MSKRLTLKICPFEHEGTFGQEEARVPFGVLANRTILAKPAIEMVSLSLPPVPYARSAKRLCPPSLSAPRPLVCTWTAYVPAGTSGAITGVVLGVFSSIFLVIVSPKVWPGADTETGSPIGWELSNPGIISIPLGFLGCWAGTMLSRESESEHTFDELFVRSETGLGSERAVEIVQERPVEEPVRS